MDDDMQGWAHQQECEHQRYLSNGDYMISEWNKFPEQEPDDNGEYDIVVLTSYGMHSDIAQYSKAKNAFYWYSRRGYPYEITDVKFWKTRPLLPSMEDENVSESRTKES